MYRKYGQKTAPAFSALPPSMAVVRRGRRDDVQGGTNIAGGRMPGAMTQERRMYRKYGQRTGLGTRCSASANPQKPKVFVDLECV